MIAPAYAQLLAAGRLDFNRRVMQVRRRFPGFDAEAFAGFLRSPMDELMAAAPPERAGAVLMAAYAVGLELVAQGWAGPRARSGWVDQAWRELAPCYPALLAAYPEQLLGLLSNAVLHLAQQPSARPAQWLELMAQLAPSVTGLRQLRSVGQLVAWRAGMAHFRAGALAAAETDVDTDTDADADALPPALALAAVGALPPALALAAVGALPPGPAGAGAGVPPGGSAPADTALAWHKVRAALLADPWWQPDPGQRAVLAASGVEVGAFTGFGGAFMAPPTVRATDAGFVVRSGARCFLLVSDACGAVLHDADSAEFDAAPASSLHDEVRLDGTHLIIGRRTVELDLPAQGLALACNADTVALTSPFSHAIRLLPLRP